MADGKPRMWLKRIAIVTATVAALAAVVYALRVPLFIWAGSQIVHADRLDQADVIVILGGGSVGRAVTAADLYADGYAPTVVLTMPPQDPVIADLEQRGYAGQSPTEARVGFLLGLGVTADAVTVLSRVVSSTEAEATLIAEWVASRAIARVIVVTDTYHSARARLAFARALSALDIDLRVHPSPFGAFDPERWWRDRFMLREGLLELQKLFYYRLMYALGRSP